MKSLKGLVDETVSSTDCFHTLGSNECCSCFALLQNEMCEVSCDLEQLLNDVGSEN